MKTNRLKGQGALAALLVLLLTACGGSAPEPEQPLEERVLARWTLMIERDFEAAWEYYTPGFRQTTPRHDFARDMARRPLRWRDAELLDIDCPEEDLCDVRLEVTVQAVGAPSGMSRMRVPSRVSERWLHLDGQWWFAAN